MSGGRNSRMGDGRSGMIIQAELKRKQSEYEGEACTVDKVIELPAQRFQQFSRALLADYDFIAENKNAIRHDTDSRHCLLILDADGTDGFLVDPQGYNYARYSAFVPNARSLLTPDMGIDRSYLSPAEPWRNENRDEILRMTLRVDGKPDYTLDLPADEAYLNAVKAYLDSTQRTSYIVCRLVMFSRHRQFTSFFIHCTEAKEMLKCSNGVAFLALIEHLPHPLANKKTAAPEGAPITHKTLRCRSGGFYVIPF